MILQAMLLKFWNYSHVRTSRGALLLKVDICLIILALICVHGSGSFKWGTNKTSSILVVVLTEIFTCFSSLCNNELVKLRGVL